MRTSIIVALLLTWILSVNAEDLDRRQASNTTASSTSSSTPLPTPNQAPTVNSSTYDLTQHYCRLFRHASIYVNGSIYIDSGDTYTPQDNGTFNTTPPGQYDAGMNVNLLVIDLSKNFTENDTFPYRTIHKPPGVPPALEDSALWYSALTRKIYQLGGWFSRNGSPGTPGYIATQSIPEAAIWEFDIDSETWTQSKEFHDVNTGHKIDRPGAAAYCDAPDLNQSFIFEGFVQQLSDPDYINYPLYDTFKYIEGMLRLDTSQPESPVLTNITIPTFLGPRTDGSMIHIPVGPKGILVLIGGQTTQNADTPWGVPVPGAAAGNIVVNMTQVDLYDIESGYWFRQTTFGDAIPAGRAALCLALITAPDNSSWNIIMVAGVLTFNGATSRQEIWALSLPTFNWVRLYGQEGALYRHTCHLVGENLLIIGGMERTLPAGDEDVTSCQSSMPARIFSIPLNNYTGKFDYPGSLRPALVPPQVVSIIGGTTTGGASKTVPLIWSDLYLQYVFNPALSRPNYTPATTYILAAPTATSTPTTSPSKIPTSSPSSSVTATPSSGPSHTGPIAGGVVGGVAGLALIGFLAFYFFIRPKRRRADDLQRSELPSYQETKSHLPVEIDDRNNLKGQPRNNDDPPVEMSIPGSPIPPGWHDERVGESGDNLTPLARDWSDNHEQDVWGREAGGVGRGHKRVGSESRFSEISNESGNTASRIGSGVSPPVTPHIPRKEIGSVGA